MKYAILYRKMVIDGEIYIQLFDKVVGKINNQVLEVEEGKFSNKKIPQMEELLKSEIVYQEISSDTYQNLVIEPTIFHLEDNQLTVLKSPYELQDVKIEFYKKYKDFPLWPEYDINELILEARNNLKKMVLGEDNAIDKILFKIYYNNMLSNTDLTTNNVFNAKSNILLLGPEGSGKTTLKNELKNNLAPIPVVECKLTGDLKNDIVNIINKLLSAANNNILLAMKGIVIYDGINVDTSKYFEEYDELYNVYLEEIKNIMNESLIYLTTNNETNAFDMSYLTHICIADVEYNKDFVVDEYSLEELGLTKSILNCFNDEIVYMKGTSFDLACKILRDKNASPLYKLKKALAKNNKTLSIGSDFIEYLINYGLSLGPGFKGIIKVLNLVLKDKIFNKNVALRKEDIEKLELDKVLMNIVDDYDYDYEEPDLQKENQIDLKKMTINGLTVNDTVNKIKENVKGQDEAIFALVNAFYNHVFNKNKDFNETELKQLKENVLFIGSTGVGKTAIVENLANIFNLTFVREIATRYSQTGYVGASVDDMLLDLVKAANNDMSKAQNGILYIDEIDKLARKSDTDSMKIAVQNDLLTLIEGDKRNVETDFRLKKTINFDTSGLFIIGTGAFDGLDKIIKGRIKKENSSAIGFTTQKKEKTINEDITLSDLYEYGFDKQLIARFSNKVKLNDLQEDVILDIINNSKNGFINLVKTSYEKSGITVKLSDAFKKKLASRVSDLKEGARGIKTLFSSFKTEIDKRIQQEEIQEVIIDEDALDDLNNITYVKKYVKK